MNINIIKHPQSQPHALENITIALDAIQEDGIKLVNIGESVIVNIFVQKQLGIKRICIGPLGPQVFQNHSLHFDGKRQKQNAHINRAML